MRTLALPDAVEQWSLTSLREKLIKIGAKIVRHGRYVVFQMAEVAIPRDLFADIMCRIDRLGTTPLPIGRQDRPSCVKTTGPVCPRRGPTGNIECHHVPFTLNFVLSGMILVAEPIGRTHRTCPLSDFEPRSTWLKGATWEIPDQSSFGARNQVLAWRQRLACPFRYRPARHCSLVFPFNKTVHSLEPGGAAGDLDNMPSGVLCR